MTGILILETDFMIELIENIETPLDALHFVLRESQANGGKDKDFYIELGIDPAQWTRIKNGSNSLALNQIPRFQHIAHNKIKSQSAYALTAKIAYDCGFEIKPLEKKHAEELAKKDSEIESLRKEISAIKGLYQELIKKPE